MALVRHRSKWLDGQTDCVYFKALLHAIYYIPHIYLWSRHQKLGRTSGTIKFLLLTFGSFTSAALPLLCFLPFLLPLLVPSFFAFFCKLSSTRDLKRHQNARRQQANFSLSYPPCCPLAAFPFPLFPSFSPSFSCVFHMVASRWLLTRCTGSRTASSRGVPCGREEAGGSEVTSASITSRE